MNDAICLIDIPLERSDASSSFDIDDAFIFAYSLGIWRGGLNSAYGPFRVPPLTRWAWPMGCLNLRGRLLG